MQCLKRREVHLHLPHGNVAELWKKVLNLVASNPIMTRFPCPMKMNPEGQWIWTTCLYLIRSKSWCTILFPQWRRAFLDGFVLQAWTFDPSWESKNKSRFQRAFKMSPAEGDEEDPSRSILSTEHCNPSLPRRQQLLHISRLSPAHGRGVGPFQSLCDSVVSALRTFLNKSLQF